MVDNKVRKRVSLKRLGGNAKGLWLPEEPGVLPSAQCQSSERCAAVCPGCGKTPLAKVVVTEACAFLGAGRSGVCGGLGPAHLWSLFKEAHALLRRESHTLRRLTPWARSAPPPGPAPATRRRGGLWTSFCENGWTVHHRPRQSPGVHQLNWHFWQRSAEARPTSQAFSTFPRCGKCRRFSSGTWKGRRWSGPAEFICVACQLKAGLSCAGVAGLCSEASRELQEDRPANLEFSLSRCPEKQDPLRGWQEGGCVSRVRPCFVWLAARAHGGCGERRHRATDKRRTGLGSDACERPSLLHHGAAGGEGVQGPRRPHVVRDHLLQKDPFPGTGHPAEGHPHRPLRGEAVWCGTEHPAHLLPRGTTGPHS